MEARPHPGLGVVDQALDLRLFREMAEMSHDGLYLIDAGGRILYVNRRGLELAGYTWEEMRRMSVADLNPEYPLQMFRDLVAAMPAAGLAPFQSAVRCKDGTVVPLEVTLARIEIGGRTYLFGVGRDIRQRKQLRKARRQFAQRMLEVIEAERLGVARRLHDDVGQAVATIGVLLHALDRTPGAFAPGTRPALEAAYATIVHVTESVARIARDHHPAELQSLGLEETLRQHVRQFGRGRPWRLRLRTTAVAGLLAPDQELHCYRIVQEALANAARHARPRLVTVRLIRRRTAIVLLVRDDGIGFDPEARPAGDGFGLTTMRERAALMGAVLAIRSRPRHGTEIRVTLPLGTAPRPAGGRAGAAAEPPLPLPPPLPAVSPAGNASGAAARELPAALDRSLFRRMADMSQDAFYLFDGQGRFRYVNDRAAILSGYSREELLRMTVFDLGTGDHIEHLPAQVAAMAHGTVPPFETRARRKDGSLIPIEVSAARIDHGDEIWLFGVVRDLREEKEMETAQASYARRLLETLEAERQRVARELHDDVGQAVAMIGVLLHQLEQPPESPAPELRSVLGESHATIQQVAETVSRIVREYHPAELVGLGLEDALRSYARQLAQHHGLELELATGTVAGLLPSEHELHLYRIAQEALTNAVRHAAARRVRVRLARHGGSLVLVVGDDGRGFTVAPEPGAGPATLGLTTMRERAEITGARVEVRSAPGRGTEVRVTVPLADS
jgi:PAS domain S-box-containing protein